MRSRLGRLMLDFTHDPPQSFAAAGTAVGKPPTAAAEPVLRAALDAVQRWRYDPPFQAPLAFPVTFKFGPDAVSAQSSAVTAVPDLRRDDALRVGGSVKTPSKTKDVRPVYPPIARDAGVQGVVIIEARIEADGRVGDARVLKSIPLLDEAALDAVRQWEFTPTLLNGEPVPVMMTMTVNFTLSQ